MRRKAGAGSPEVIAGIIAVLLLILIAAWFLMLGPVKVSMSVSPAGAALTTGTPIHTAVFESGLSLEILKVAEGAVELGSLTARSGSAHESSLRSIGWRSNCQSLTVKIDGTVTGRKFAFQPGTLAIACRLVGANGAPWVARRFAWEGSLKGETRGKPRAPDWQTMVTADGPTEDLPEVFIQMSDGAGGWIDGEGPYGETKDPLCLSVIAFRAWPRSGAHLEFRAIMPGQAPVSWTLPNPAHPVTPASWAPDPLPVKVSEPEFDLEFFGASTPPKRQDVVIPKFRFISKVQGEEGLPPDWQSWKAECAEVKGALGTRSMVEDFRMDGGYSFSGYRLPPDESLLRFLFTVRPTESYRYARTEIVPLLAGIIWNGGKEVSIASHSLASHGLVSASAEVKDGIQWHLKFKWLSDSDRRAAETALCLKDGKPVCLVGGSETSVGEATFTDRGSSSSDGVTEADFTVSWSGIPSLGQKTETPSGPSQTAMMAMPPPGETVTLGMVIARPAQEFQFTTPRPSGVTSADDSQHD